MGQGVVTKRAASHTYHRGLSHADWLAHSFLGHGHWVASPGYSGCGIRVNDNGLEPQWLLSDYSRHVIT